MGLSKLSFALLAVALVAAPPGLHQEGGFWVETTSGSEAMPQLEQLRVVTAGDVWVKGGPGGDITYVVTRKVKARNEAQARDELQEAGLNFTRQGRGARLVVNDPTGPVELHLTVPRAVAKLMVITAVGNIDVAEIDGSVSGETAGGNVSLHNVKGNGEITSHGGNLDVGEVGGSARAISAGGDIRGNSIGGEARLETAGGDISIAKIGGAMRAVTAGGTIRIGQIGGAAIAETGGGTIEIGKAGGMVNIHNQGGGAIQVGSSAGAHCENASGAIHVGSWNGALHLATASGSVVAQLLGDRLLSDSSISTASGDITVYIPSNVGVMIQAQSEGGHAQSIVSEFGTVQVHWNGSRATAVGPVNGGGPLLRLEGTGGTIYIKKKQ